jgi:hypothetical protein
MARHTLISSFTAACCIAAIITITSGCPSLAFTASSYGPMKQRARVTAVQQQAHRNQQDPSMDHVPRRLQPPRARSTLLIPQYLTTAAMAVITIMMTLPLQPSNAGLLDEYGAGLTVNPPTKKSETATAAPSAPSNGGSVQIDPTLRGCTFLFVWMCCLCNRSHFHQITQCCFYGTPII